nr:DUF4097 family beta strand repeat-containing protein [Phytoactinopolyspora alkaliphila]
MRVEVSRGSIGPSLLRDPAIKAIITVPLTSSVEVRTGSADVHLGGGLGSVNVKTGSGTIVAEQCDDVALKTGSGNIHASEVKGVEAHSGSGDLVVEHATGALDLDTASGNSRIDHIHGRGVVRTASGDIEIGTVEAVVRVKTASGDVRIRRMVEGEIDAKTASGDITIGIATGTAAKLDCSSASGRVRSDLDPTDAPSDTDLVAAIAARSASGSITLTRAH